MAVVYLAGRAFDQRSPPLNALAVVAAVLVAADPLTVTDPAFILTFAATLAILISMPLVAGRRCVRSIGGFMHPRRLLQSHSPAQHFGTPRAASPNETLSHILALDQFSADFRGMRERTLVHIEHC